MIVFFFKQKTAYEMRISDWSSDVCSSDLRPGEHQGSGLREELLVAGPHDYPQQRKYHRKILAAGAIRFGRPDRAYRGRDRYELQRHGWRGRVPLRHFHLALDGAPVER